MLEIDAKNKWSLGMLKNIATDNKSWNDALEYEKKLIKYYPEIKKRDESKLNYFVAMDYKDKKNAAQQWLSDLGDPYEKIGRDIDGRTAIDWGVYGVPETYIIDRNGLIQYRHVGPLSQRVFDDKLAPVLTALRKQEND